MENSHERLINMLARRAETGADHDVIDQKIWDTFGETWSVMFTDLSGFSRNSANFGIIHFIQVIVESEKLFAPILGEHNAFIIKREGDSLMILFHNPKNALDAAIAMQNACQTYSLSKPPEEKVILCLGISHGRILRLGSNEVFGNAVNSASKLGEDTAGPHEILVTNDFVDAYDGDLELNLEAIDFKPPGSDRAYLVKYPHAVLTGDDTE
jgi:class 3 adenylate cyclase